MSHMPSQKRWPPRRGKSSLEFESCQCKGTWCATPMTTLFITAPLRNSTFIQPI